MRIGTIFCLWIMGAATLSAQTLEESLFLRRIADFWEEGEYAIAKHQMGEFLNTFAESSYSDTLRMTLGDLFLREKNFSEALNCYAQISNPKVANQVFIRRMQCLYHLQWHATLADECEAYLQRSEDPEQAAVRLEATYLLAIALYEQCNHPATPDTPIAQIAERAKPYFEILAKSPLSKEVVSAFVHLRCILKDYEGSAQIYLNLAKEAENPEEHLFQAALLQSKYDKALSIQTFSQISALNGQLQSEAAYNRLVICFDLGKFEDLIANKEALLKAVPEEKTAFAHLILGQSFLALKEYNNAAGEFDGFLTCDTSVDSCTQALQPIIEVAYRTNNLNLLDKALEKWTQQEIENPHLATASFTRAQILKKEGRLEDAKKEISTLLTRCPHFKNRPEAVFNLIQLEATAARFTACRESAIFFLKQYPDHELSPAAWRHLLFASAELAEESNERKSQLIQDLEAFLSAKIDLSAEEQFQIQFRLAKAYFDLGASQESLNLLEPLCENMPNVAEEMKANAELLLALSYETALQDLSLYCEWAELALSHKATLLPIEQQHLKLFNAYLLSKPDETERLAGHLTASFLLKADVSLTNLLWLAQTTYEKDAAKAPLCVEIGKAILARAEVDPKNIGPDTLYLEAFLLNHAKWLQECQNIEESIEWLALLNAQYNDKADIDWRCEREVKLALAEAFLATGKTEKAETLFDWLASSAVLRDRFAAKAALQSARIKRGIDKSDPTQVLTMLKNISLQKTLSNEPIHLEAAIDYIELLASLQPAEKGLEKKLDLLMKMKANFEAQEDLLSKDYHASREADPKHNQIYLDYMLYLDAKILLTRAQLEKREEEQKELQANAKELLLRIDGRTNPDLQKRLEVGT